MPVCAALPSRREASARHQEQVQRNGEQAAPDTRAERGAAVCVISMDTRPPMRGCVHPQEKAYAAHTPQPPFYPRAVKCGGKYTEALTWFVCLRQACAVLCSHARCWGCLVLQAAGDVAGAHEISSTPYKSEISRSFYALARSCSYLGGDGDGASGGGVQI